MLLGVGEQLEQAHIDSWTKSRMKHGEAYMAMHMEMD